MADPVYRPDPRRDADAEVIAEGAGQWLHITLRETVGAFKAGERFYGIPSSKGDGSIYYTNFRFCSCRDYAKRGQGCKHQRAALLHAARVHQERQRQGGSADSADPTPTAAPADPDGSRAYLASLQDQQAAHARALRAAGTDPADDATYRQRAEWIARLESRHATQAHDAARVPTARPSYADVFGADD